MSFSNYQEDKFNQQLVQLLACPEVKKMDQYIQHGDTTCLEHCLAVTYASYRMAQRLKLDIDADSLVRGALLHDFFLYDWHDKNAHHRLHGFRHPKIALNNALKLFDLNETEQDIICHHMWPLTLTPPHTKEAYIVTCMDKWCSIKETIKRPAVKRIMVKFRSLINN